MAQQNKSRPGLNTWVKNQASDAKNLFNEYPRQFWVLVGSAFIDRLGGSLLFPFFSLYITSKFNVGMTEVGFIFAIFSITGLLSSILGGALTDRLGRKGIVIFGLCMSALSALMMGFVTRIEWFLVATAIVGLLADVGGPAQQAMVADLLPEHKRAQGYGILRVVFNLAVVIGPMIGGFLAAKSYLFLFVIDAVTSIITAGVVFFALKETKKARTEDEPQESMGTTFKGYFHVLRDSSFAWFLLASMLSVIMYMQMNTTLAVYLRDTHGVSTQMFGYILSLNAAMVVLFQFPITRWISKYRPLMVMVAGTLFYAFGFSMYGYVSIYPLFLFAMVIITIGEMLVSPVSQAIVSNLAPEDMRGRYMATYGFSWVIPAAIGPLLAGLVIDNFDPRLLWFIASGIGLLSAACYYLLEHNIGRSRWAAIDDRLRILQNLEEGKITAEEASTQIHAVQEGKWARLTPKGETKKVGQLHIRVSDPESGDTRKELLLPLGLVNTIMNTDCHLAAGVDEHFDMNRLRTLVAAGAAGSLENTNGQRVEISRRED